VGGREGVTLFEFTIDQAGIYQLAVWYDTTRGPEIVLAIGKDAGRNLMRAILITFATSGGLTVLGLGIAVVTFRKRRRGA
jgi:hypothetical protein